MYQLKFNDEFNNITFDTTYWITEEDIPEHIKQFITDTSNMRVIYDAENNKFYCGKCVEELDTNNYCKKCDIKHKMYSLDDIYCNPDVIIIIDDIMTTLKYGLHATHSYYTFHIVDNNIFLYTIKENICYDKKISNRVNKTSEICIDKNNSYYIEKNGITNMGRNIFISYQNIIDYHNNQEDNTQIKDTILHLNLAFEDGYFYTNNLNDLKDTIYHYSRIWELKDYLKNQRSFKMLQFIYPLCYPQFEYLINFKLYNLAWKSPFMFKKENNFKKIMGVEKKYLPFMVENNIDVETFKILQVYPTDDIELLNFFSLFCEDIERILSQTKIDLPKIKKFLSDNELYISEYLQYIDMAVELKLDVTDKKILYPKNFMNAYNELFTRTKIIRDTKINAKIKHWSYFLSFNSYEDDEYVIYPASSVEELVNESSQQHNCVRNYCEKISKNESQIYFMRKKKELEKSFVTIEVQGVKIAQARVKYNKLPSDDINFILHQWESNLIPVNSEQ